MTRRAVSSSVVALMIAATALCESTRTVRATLSAAPGTAFVVENLAGRMTVVPGDTDAVVAIATVHAESAELAGAVSLEQVRGEKGEPTLRVRYPLGFHRTVRYPGTARSTAEYDGRRVRVSGTSGVLLYADVEVHVPGHAVIATFRNLFGSLDARNVTGTIVLDTSGADIVAHALQGDIKADVGSGDVTADQIKGKFSCDTGSGECDVTGFDGDQLLLDTGSGGVRVRDVKAARISADTGSGNVGIERADTAELVADTGSGSVQAELIGSRLRRIRADTGSGSVTLRLPADASFELLADQGSGNLTCDFPDATPIAKKRMIVGYRRGDGRIRIDVDTGSGDVTVSPVSGK